MTALPGSSIEVIPFSSSFPSSGGTSKAMLFGEIGVQFFLHACREYCLSLYVIGHESEYPPSAWTSPWMLVDCLLVTLLDGTLTPTFCKLYG